jgi:hypothetical protein
MKRAALAAPGVPVARPCNESAASTSIDARTSLSSTAVCARLADPALPAQASAVSVAMQQKALRLLRPD